MTFVLRFPGALHLSKMLPLALATLVASISGAFAQASGPSPNGAIVSHVGIYCVNASGDDVVCDGTIDGSEGQLQYNHSGAFKALPSGATGQILQSSGSGNAPVWADAPSGGSVTSSTISSAGGLLATNNLSDVASPAMALANLGAATPASVSTAQMTADSKCTLGTTLGTCGDAMLINPSATMTASGGTASITMAQLAAAYNNRIQVLSARNSGTPLGMTYQTSGGHSVFHEHIPIPAGAVSLAAVFPGFTQLMFNGVGTLGEFVLPDSIYYATSCNAVNPGFNYTVGSLATMPVYGYGARPAVCQVDQIENVVTFQASVTAGSVVMTINSVNSGGLEPVAVNQVLSCNGTGAVTFPDFIGYFSTFTVASGQGTVGLHAAATTTGTVTCSAIGGVAKAHVRVPGIYSTQLPDGTVQASSQYSNMAGTTQYGFGAYGEAILAGGVPSSYVINPTEGGYAYYFSVTNIGLEAGAACSGITFSSTSSNYDINRSILSVVPSGIPKCTGTISGFNVPLTFTTTLGGNYLAGQGARWAFSWAGAAYAVDASVDPTYANETCVANVTGGPAGGGNCQHKILTASKDNNQPFTGLGVPGFIYVHGGHDLLTDFAPVQVSVGGNIGLRLTVWGNYPTSRNNSMPGELAFVSSGTVDDYARSTDVFGSTTLPLPPATSSVAGGAITSALYPVAIIGKPIIATPYAMVLGNSRDQGRTGISAASVFDTYDYAGGASGWFERALEQITINGVTGMPYLQESHSGDTTQSLIRSDDQRLEILKIIQSLGGRPPALCFLGDDVNDITNGTSLATILTYDAEIAQHMRGAGCPYVVTASTLPENTFSGQPYDSVSWAQVATVGSGYTPNTTIQMTVVGGTGTSALFNVAIDGHGSCLGIANMVNPGKYTVNPPLSRNAPTGGTGSGCTFNLYVTNDVTGVTQTRSIYQSVISARNVQLRTSGLGSFGGVFDNFIDWAGVTEDQSSLGNWLPNMTCDGVHACLPGILTEATYATPILAGWMQAQGAKQ